MSKVYLTSDLHLNHRNIIKYCNRPFATTGEMDARLLDNINKTVGENDLLIHLGDFCFGSKDSYYQIAQAYRNRIVCKNIINIWGNHDHRKIHDLFSETYDLYTLIAQNQKMVLCHYAMAIWKDSHKSAWHLYGHSHATAEKMLDTIMPGRRSMDVGVDNAAKILGEYRPFSVDEIRKIMEKKAGFQFDHHRRNGTEAS